MKNLCYIILLFATHLVSAQNIAPVGSTWHYRTGGSAGNPILDDIKLIEAVKDTIIDGISYRVMELRRLHKILPPQYLTSYYFHDSAGDVTFWHRGQVYPYFNFSAHKGDTVYTSLYEPSDGTISGLSATVDSIYIDQYGLKSYVFGQPAGIIVKQQLFQSYFLTSFLEAIRFGGPLEGHTILRCFTNNTISVKTAAGPCDSIPYHSFNNKIQYYYSMWKPHLATEAPFYRLVKDTAASADQFWLRYYDKNDVRNTNGDVLCKENLTSRKLYVWKGAWYVLYDFYAQKGDTVSSIAITNPLHILNKAAGYESVQQFRYVIDSVYEEKNRMVQIPRLLAGEQWTIPGKIYEGIGSDVALFGWPTQYDTTGREGYLRCFFNSDWGLSFFNPNKDVQQCNSLFTALNNEIEKSKTGLSVFPNPATTIFEIQNYPGNGEVKVYDATGKCKGTFNYSTIDVSDWTAGIYLVVIFAGKQYSSGKFVVQR